MRHPPIKTLLLFFWMGSCAALVAQPAQPTWSIGGGATVAGTRPAPGGRDMPAKVGVGMSANVWMERAVRSFRKPGVYPNSITGRNRLNETGLSFAVIAKI